MLAAGLLAAASPAAAQPDFGNARPWQPWAEFGGYFGPAGASRGEAALWAPLYQTPVSLGFVEIRGKLFMVDTQEANLAFGFRRMLPIGVNIGFWGGYDLRNTASGNLFHQLSGGVEVLGDRFAFRANGYLPLDSTAVTTTTGPGAPAIRLYNNNTSIGLFNDIVTATTRELALAGVDVEAGFSVPVAERNGRSHEVWLYGGGFLFDHALLQGAVIGPKARAEWRIDNVFTGLPGSRLTFETEFSYDPIRNARWEAGLRLRVPLAPVNADGGMSRQQLRMAESLERDTDIVSVSGGTITQTVAVDDTAEAVEDPLTGTRIDRVVIGDTPAELLAAAGLGQNTLIVAQGGSGTIDLTASEGLALVTDQVLQGGGSTIDFRGITSGITAPFTAPGERPTLLSTASTNPDRGVVTVATRNHVVGLDIIGDAGCGCGFNDGIRGLDDLHTVVIEQNSIRQMGGGGILFDQNNSDIVIRDNALSEIASFGIGLGVANRRVTIANNSVVDATAGVLLSAGNDDVTVRGNLFRNNFAGVVIDAANTNVTVDQNAFDDSFFGIVLEHHNTDIAISGNAFTALLGGALVADRVNQRVTITGNTVSDTATAFLFGNRNTDITIADNVLNLWVDPFTTPILLPPGGVVFEDNNERVMITGNTISNSLFDAISFTDRNSDVTIAGNAIHNAGADAIHFDDRNTGLVITGNTLTGSILDDGLRVGRNNEATVADNRFDATFGDDIIDLNNQGNTLTGGGNTVGGTFADQLCEVTGAQTGTIAFTNPVATCP